MVPAVAPELTSLQNGLLVKSARTPAWVLDVCAHWGDRAPAVKRFAEGETQPAGELVTALYQLALNQPKTLSGVTSQAQLKQAAQWALDEERLQESVRLLAQAAAEFKTAARASGLDPVTQLDWLNAVFADPSPAVSLSVQPETGRTHRLR